MGNINDMKIYLSVVHVEILTITNEFFDVVFEAILVQWLNFEQVAGCLTRQAEQLLPTVTQRITAFNLFTWYIDLVFLQHRIALFDRLNAHIYTNFVVA